MFNLAKIIAAVLGFLVFALIMVVVISAIAIFTVIIIGVPFGLVVLAIVLIVRAVRNWLQY